MPANLENSAVATGLEKASFHSNPKERQCQKYSNCHKIALISHSSKFSSVQLLSCVRLFVTPWIAALQASLSITNSQNLLRLMSIESMMPSSHLILCRPLILLPPMPPSIRVFSNESAPHMRWPSTGVSALTSFLPKKSQGWSPSEWIGWISLQSKGLSSLLQYHSSKASILQLYTR